jgi:hypothetical protein
MLFLAVAVNLRADARDELSHFSHNDTHGHSSHGKPLFNLLFNLFKH